MAYNSKYTGQQVEALLDIVKQGGSSGGEGGTITEAELLAMGFTKNLGTITEVKMNGASKGTSGVVDLGTVITEHQDISGKQDKITDLDEIRSNASMVLNKQDIISDLATIRSNASQVSSKQDAISDLDAIRSGASKGATALQSIPEEYVTEADLEDKDYAPMSVLDNKVDKVSGKGLSTEDFTSALKAKLESLSNYNDTEIAGAVSSLQTQINTLVSGNADDAINSFNEIIAFLAGVKDSEDLDNIIASIEQQIASKQDKIEGLDDINEKLEAINNIVDADGYLYSNGEKVDMRFTRSLLPVGTAIPAKANLNTIAYLKIGKYYCSLNVNAETVTNCPSSVAFSMEVFNPLGVNVDDETTRECTYRLRVLTKYDTGQQFIQFCKTSGTAGSWTYGTWYVSPITPFTLNSKKNGGSAAKGASNRGVYIDSTGTFQQMGYTIGKSVPSNAVFTDTNTKVTAVGNHYTPTEDTEQALNAPEGEVVTGIKRDAAGHVVGVTSSPISGGSNANGNILTCEFMGEVGDVIWSDDDTNRVAYIHEWMEELSNGKVCVLDFDDYEGTYAMVHAINYRSHATFGLGISRFSYAFEGYLYEVEYDEVSLPVTITIVNKTKIGGEGGSNTDGGAEPMVCAYRIASYTANHIELENYTYNGQTMNYREGAIILITNPLGEDVVFEGGTLTLDGNEYEADAFTIKVGATALFTLGVDSGILFPVSSVVESNSGGSSEGGGSTTKEVVLVGDDTIDLLEPNKIYLFSTIRTSLQISEIVYPDGYHAEYCIMSNGAGFGGESSSISLIFPDNISIYWVGDDISSISNADIWELSIVYTESPADSCFKCVLTKFT